MISYRKNLDIAINFFKINDRKNKNRELKIEYVSYDDRIRNPMKIYIPDTQEYIIVDAEYMKQSCEKILDMGRL
jgi:hypothetical protein